MTVFGIEYTLLALVLCFLVCALLREEKKKNRDEEEHHPLSPLIKHRMSRRGK